MKLINGIAILVCIFSIFGCSSQGKAPVTTVDLSNTADLPTAFNPIPVADFSYEETNWEPVFAGRFIPDSSGGFELVEDRQNLINVDVTSQVLGAGAFSYEILQVNGNVFEIDLTIENPTSLQVYDLRMIFNDIGPSKVINPDSYTMLFSSEISPYFCFAKSDPDRMFPIGPGVSDTRNMFLEYNGGYPGFTIAVSMQEVCEEPFEVANPLATGELNELDGGWAVLSCVVLDHQWDLEYVGADLSLFTGDYEFMVADPYNPNKFEIFFSNELLAPAGTYQAWMAAKSIGSPLLCYNMVELEVGGGIDPPVVVITFPDVDPYDTAARNIDIVGDITNFSGTEATMEVNGTPQTISVSGGHFDDIAILVSGDNFIKVSAEGPGGIGSDTVTVNSSAANADLWIRLTWDKDDTDVDLYITEPGPSNFTCWYSDKISPDSGAQLDIDNISGFGPEHYYLSVAEGHTLYPGIYEIDVHYFSDHSTGRTPIATILVYLDGSYYGEWTHLLDYADSGEDSPVNRRQGLPSWWDSVADIDLN